jgi:hypothetical protein
MRSQWQLPLQKTATKHKASDVEIPWQTLSRAHCNCSCSRDSQRCRTTEMQKEAVRNMQWKRCRKTNRNSPGLLPSTAVILTLRALSNIFSYLRQSRHGRDLRSRERAQRKTTSGMQQSSAQSVCFVALSSVSLNLRRYRKINSRNGKHVRIANHKRVRIAEHVHAYHLLHC